MIPNNFAVRKMRGLKRRVKGSIRQLVRNVRLRTISISSCLLGDESEIDAAKFARLVNNPLRPSTPIADSPHVKFLIDYQNVGEGIFEAGYFRATDYYRNALLSLDIVGFFFNARSPDAIVEVARRFIDRYRGSAEYDTYTRRLDPEFPIRVRPIMHSDCYQVIDGHHRLAIDYVRGKTTATVLIDSSPVLTPLQALLLDVLWLEGRIELYQPVDAPEVRTWTLVRRCSDRMEKIRQFLRSEFGESFASMRSLDLGSSYGWFVSEFGKLGFSAFGLERDPIAVSVGFLMYGLQSAQIFRSDMVRFLEERSDVYDVVSCFSVIHHFARGNARISADALIRRIDRFVGRVLFLDTGQSHEAWFQKSLPQWDADYIERWIKANTTFRRVVRLGQDEDAVSPYQDNYSRMLFACVR